MNSDAGRTVRIIIYVQYAGLLDSKFLKGLRIQAVNSRLLLDLCY